MNEFFLRFWSKLLSFVFLKNFLQCSIICLNLFHGVSPFRIFFKIGSSMFPPEMIQTILPGGISSVIAAAAELAPAPSANILFLYNKRRTAVLISSVLTNIESCTRRDAIFHMDGYIILPFMPSTKVRCQP